MNPTSTPLTTLIKEMREASEKATPGPWETSEDKGGYMGVDSLNEPADWVCPPCEEYNRPSIADAQHIALCNPENIRRVLDACEEMREKMELFIKVYNTRSGLVEFGQVSSAARAVLAKHFKEGEK